MRIMHVILSRGFGESEGYVAELASFQATEHEVTILLRRNHRSRSGTSIVDAVSNRVEIRTVSAWWRAQHSVDQHIQDFQPDIIHTHLRRSSRLISRVDPDTLAVATLHARANGRHCFQLDGVICHANWHVPIPSDYQGRVFELAPLLPSHHDSASPVVLPRLERVRVDLENPEQFHQTIFESYISLIADPSY
jgi:hypothetical protein